MTTRLNWDVGWLFMAAEIPLWMSLASRAGLVRTNL